MIPNIHMFSQQLANPQFDNPKDLVSWMGAIQAQDCVMSKWAVGIRLKTPALRQVEKALESCQVVRIHILRPTWHMVAAEDVRWMLKLTGRRLRSTCLSWGKSFGVDEKLLSKCCKQLEKMLENGRHLSKQEIGDELLLSKTITDKNLLSCLLSLSEIDGLICNGIERNKKHTYALMDERVPPAKDFAKEEMLAMLAQRYFRSHSPASLQDFAWWSGLTTTDAKHAVKLIDRELISDRFETDKFYLHEQWANQPAADEIFHLLPPYDEFLISYKERTHVLPKEHSGKAFTPYGIFYPVTLYNGKVIGNWKKSMKKNRLCVETAFFDNRVKVGKKQITQAEKRYRDFVGSAQ